MKSVVDMVVYTVVEVAEKMVVKMGFGGKKKGGGGEGIWSWCWWKGSGGEDMVSSGSSGGLRTRPKRRARLVAVVAAVGYR